MNESIQVFNLIIPANGSVRVDMPGNYIRIRSLSGVSEIDVKREDDAIVLPMSATNSFTYAGDGYEYLLFENPNGAQATASVLMGFGKFEAQEISGQVTIDTSAGAVSVADAALLAMLQNANDQRRAITSLAGASFAQGNNANTTIVSAVSNVNGIMIRYAESFALAATGVSANARLRIGGLQEICTARVQDGASAINNINQSIRDVLIPAGQSLETLSNSATSFINVWYEVL